MTFFKAIKDNGVAGSFEGYLESDSDLQRLEGELLYSWFSAADFVRGFIATSAAVTAAPLPFSVSQLLLEARRCYAFQQNVAAACVCRAAIEEGVNELFLTKGGIPDMPRDKAFHEQYRFRKDRLSRLCDQTDEKRIYGLYCRLSESSHGLNKGIVKTLDLLKETVAVMELLFTKYK